ncbi:sugar phosphate nucleotidyltransferase, partial [Streptomyces sp. NPDC005921]
LRRLRHALRRLRRAPVLPNLVNADVLRICVLTQYKSHSLDRHITTTWRMSSLLGNYVTPVPAQQRLGPRWYLGSADALLQSLNLVNDEQPEYVAVFGADHVYRMDPRQMLQQHIEGGAGVTVAGIRVPRAESSAFGVIKPGSDGQTIETFLEKPADPPGLPDAPDTVFASMGNYIFSTKTLIESLHRDAEDDDSVHDMGGSILPQLTARGEAQLYDFGTNHVPVRPGTATSRPAPRTKPRAPAASSPRRSAPGSTSSPRTASCRRWTTTPAPCRPCSSPPPWGCSR